MGIRNSNQNYTGLIEKYVGTAYDRMAELQSRLEELLLISASIDDGSFDEVAQIADEIQGLINKINEFNSTYYGTRETPPSEDPLGDPITEGDLYFNSTVSLLYVYVDGFWIPLGSVNNKVIYRVVSSADFTGNIATIDIGHDPSGKPYTYTPGSNNMTVHRNGDLILGKHTDSSAGTYTEINNTEIQFVNEDLNNPVIVIGDELIFHIGTEAATVSHIGEVDIYIYETLFDGESVIVLPEGLSYVPGTNNITVHRRLDNGHSRELLLLSDVNGGEVRDYIETSPTRLTLEHTVAKGTQIVLTIGHIIANDDAHYQIIMSPGSPKPNEMDYEEGQLWFKTDTGRMYILYFDDVPNIEIPGEKHINRQWISTTPEDTVIGPNYEVPVIPASPIIHGTIFQDLAPDPYAHSEGTLWFNIQTGNLHINYKDLDTHQWVKVST